jgi:hypothetical protein
VDNYALTTPAFGTSGTLSSALQERILGTSGTLSSALQERILGTSGTLPLYKPMIILTNLAKNPPLTL